MKAYNPELLFR